MDRIANKVAVLSLRSRSIYERGFSSKKKEARERSASLYEVGTSHDVSSLEHSSASVTWKGIPGTKVTTKWGMAFKSNVR